MRHSQLVVTELTLLVATQTLPNLPSDGTPFALPMTISPR
jgi:hypothetical protein